MIGKLFNCHLQITCFNAETKKHYNVRDDNIVLAFIKYKPVFIEDYKQRKHRELFTPTNKSYIDGVVITKVFPMGETLYEVEKDPRYNFKYKKEWISNQNHSL